MIWICIVWSGLLSHLESYDNGPYCVFSGVLISALVEVSLPQENSGWQEDDCRRALREAKSVKVEAQTPPKLVGHWTSYG